MTRTTPTRRRRRSLGAATVLALVLAGAAFAPPAVASPALPGPAQPATTTVVKQAAKKLAPAALQALRASGRQETRAGKRLKRALGGIQRWASVYGSGDISQLPATSQSCLMSMGIAAATAQGRLDGDTLLRACAVGYARAQRAGA